MNSNCNSKISFNSLLSFNDKLINLFSSLDGRDKVFKFVQYFSKIVYYSIEKRYIYKIINIVFKRIINQNKSKIIINNSNNKIREYFNEKLTVEKLKSLETSLYDARIVYRLFGLFREFRNVVEYFRSISFKQIYNNSNNSNKIIKLIKSLKSFTNISKSFLTTLELVDLFFSFVSEINDLAFWGIRIKLFQIKNSLFYKVSDFIWIYSLIVFIARLLYGLVVTQISIINQNKLIKNNNNNGKELEILYSNRKNEIRSLISAIGELGLCICSIYEIDNDLVIGLSGSISAFISLQEIWKEISNEKENQENENQIISSDTSTNNNNNNNTSSPILTFTHATVCPPQIHVHSN